MSIQSEITRLSGNISDALTAIATKGVTIPTGSNSDDLAMLIGQIQTGGGGAGAISIVDTPDSAGGTVRTITAVDISGDTVTASHLETGYTAHDASGSSITGTLFPGLYYEEGQFQPSEDTNAPVINFQNTSGNRPFYVQIIDVTQSTPASSSITDFAVISLVDLYGEPYGVGTLGRTRVGYWSTSGYATGGASITSLTGGTTSSMDYYLTDEMCKGYSASSRMYRTGRTYKWIAVWLPTT